jgi:hypothetical protein
MKVVPNADINLTVKEKQGYHFLVPGFDSVIQRSVMILIPSIQIDPSCGKKVTRDIKMSIRYGSSERRPLIPRIGHVNVDVSAP